MGASDGTVYSKRVGIAISDSLYGPCGERKDQPIILPDSDPSAWNSACTTNPAFVQHPNGDLWLYYKSWSINDWEYDLIHGDGIKTTRQYGLATAKSLLDHGKRWVMLLLWILPMMDIMLRGRCLCLD